MTTLGMETVLQWILNMYQNIRKPLLSLALENVRSSCSLFLEHPINRMSVFKISKFLAILVTGGSADYFTYTSAEILSTNGSSLCELPQMEFSQSLSSHTQNGLTACGGWSDSHGIFLNFLDLGEYFGLNIIGQS